MQTTDYGTIVIKNRPAQSVRAINAERLVIEDCSALADLYAPCAKSVIVHRCPRLASVSADAAEYVTLYNVGLSTLILPMADKVTVEYGPALKELSAPHARYVLARGCGKLERVYAPKAQLVDVTGSQTAAVTAEHASIVADRDVYYAGVDEEQEAVVGFRVNAKIWVAIGYQFLPADRALMQGLAGRAALVKQAVERLTLSPLGIYT